MARTPIMATRTAETHMEAEPVVVDTDTTNVVRLQLDDGGEITMDRRELLAALEEAA